MLKKALFNLHLKLNKKCRFTDTKILDLTKELFIVQIPEIEIVCNIKYLFQNYIIRHLKNNDNP